MGLAWLTDALPPQYGRDTGNDSTRHDDGEEREGEMSQRSTAKRVRRLPASLIALVVLACAGFAPSASASAKVTEAVHPAVIGPVVGGARGFPFLSSTLDLAKSGYTEEEYFVEGTATDFSPNAPLTSDGRWSVGPGPDRAPYKIRILVRRPTSQRHFNGTVIVEWANVTAGYELPGDWAFGSSELLRHGYAYVLVSAQQLGVQGSSPNSLVNWDPQRYGSLTHPGDSFSYEIFSQAGRALAAPRGVNPLDGLRVKSVVADGESQSANRLTTYYNAVQPLARVFDGFVIHSRTANGAALAQSPQAPIALPTATRYRTDQRVPVQLVQTETDLITLGYFPARQEDSRWFRDWEVAGASHADGYFNAQQAADVTKSAGAPFEVMGCSAPINPGITHHYVLNAGYRHMVRWSRGGPPPPRGPRLEIDPGPPAMIVRDSLGNARGGIRLPDIEVPVSLLSGEGNSGPTFCSLYGRNVAFDPAALRTLYPTRREYLRKYVRATGRAVLAGFLLPPDAFELVVRAARGPRSAVGSP